MDRLQASQSHPQLGTALAKLDIRRTSNQSIQQRLPAPDDLGRKGTHKGIVVVYLSPLGEPLRWAHQQSLLEADARTIAKLKNYEFDGYYPVGNRPAISTFFVPDQTLLLEEAVNLGIRDSDDLYGGVVPHPFTKTKAISHQLLDDRANRPKGWSTIFAERIRDVVLPGYTAFDVRDARLATERMLQHGAAIRAKKPLSSGGRGQIVVRDFETLDRFLADFTRDEIATYGIVLEENLQLPQTLSVGRVNLHDVTITYHGKQRRTKDNEGRTVYGGTDLVCVRGDWAALEILPKAEKVRKAVEQAKLYDSAMSAYAGFIASRRNYDVGQGMDVHGVWRSGVFESSWRAGGASPAELLAMTRFLDDPDLQVAEVSHVEKFGDISEPPRGPWFISRAKILSWGRYFAIQL